MALTDDGIPSNLENRPKSKGWKWEKDPLGPKFFLTRIQSDILMHKNVEKRERVSLIRFDAEKVDTFICFLLGMTLLSTRA